jgi:hypothetical protein
MQVKQEFGFSPLISAKIYLSTSWVSLRRLLFLVFATINLRSRTAIGMHGPSGLVISGLAAGCTEAVLVVTPSETIKTKLIHDANKAVPQYKGLAHGIQTIISQEGVRGIYRGLSAVVARQGANSAVRMSSYSMIRERLAKEYPIDAKLGKPIVPWFVTFFSGKRLCRFNHAFNSCHSCCRGFGWDNNGLHHHAIGCSQDQTSVNWS